MVSGDETQFGSFLRVPKIKLSYFTWKSSDFEIISSNFVLNGSREQFHCLSFAFTDVHSGNKNFVTYYTVMRTTKLYRN